MFTEFFDLVKPVSTNINPDPRKKHVGEKFFLFIGFVFWMKKNEETKIKKSVDIQSQSAILRA